MRLAPWIARQGGADGIFRLGFDGEDHALLIGERSPQDNNARVHEPSTTGPRELGRVPDDVTVLAGQSTRSITVAF